MHRAKHAQGDCVWITWGIVLHPLRVSRPPVAQLLDHIRRTPFPDVALPLSRVSVQRCLLPVTAGHSVFDGHLWFKCFFFPCKSVY